MVAPLAAPVAVVVWARVEIVFPCDDPLPAASPPFPASVLPARATPEMSAPFADPVAVVVVAVAETVAP
jgi:hypothetical protein